MTVFLVLATVLVVVTVHWLLQRRRSRIADAARGAVRYVEGAPSVYPPSGFLLHPGHAWVHVHDPSLASIGATSFASNFPGELASVELPPEGKRLHETDPLCTLTSTTGRRLDLRMPIEGKVLAVNRELADDPSLAQRRPYSEGWLLRVRPRRLGETLRHLLPPGVALTWIDATRARITAQLVPAVGSVVNDGGELVEAFGDLLSDEDWDALHEQLFETCDEVAERGGTSDDER